jgi:DNA-binding transcriptional ArsR family regulator
MPLEPGPVLRETAARFALLGDPTRLHLLSLLLERDDYSVGELAAAAGVSVANASQHLRRLEAGGILGRQRHGSTVRYRVVENSVERLCSIVCASVAERARVLIPADPSDGTEMTS